MMTPPPCTPSRSDGDAGEQWGERLAESLVAHPLGFLALVEHLADELLVGHLLVEELPEGVLGGLELLLEAGALGVVEASLDLAQYGLEGRQLLALVHLLGGGQAVVGAQEGGDEQSHHLVGQAGVRRVRLDGLDLTIAGFTTDRGVVARAEGGASSLAGLAGGHGKPAFCWSYRVGSATATQECVDIFLYNSINR